MHHADLVQISFIYLPTFPVRNIFIKISSFKYIFQMVFFLLETLIPITLPSPPKKKKIYNKTIRPHILRQSQRIFFKRLCSPYIHTEGLVVSPPSNPEDMELRVSNSLFKIGLHSFCSQIIASLTES